MQLFILFLENKENSKYFIEMYINYIKYTPYTTPSREKSKIFPNLSSLPVPNRSRKILFYFGGGDLLKSFCMNIRIVSF